MEKQCVTKIKIICDGHLRKKHLQSHCDNGVVINN